MGGGLAFARLQGISVRLWFLGVWLAVTTFCLHLGAQGTGSASVSISVRSTFDWPSTETAEGLTRVMVPGCEQWERPGEPCVPFRTLRILLPPDFHVDQVVADSDLPTLTVPGDWFLDFGRIPQQRPNLASPLGAPAVPDEPDWQIYLSDAPYPAVLAELASIQRLAGYDIAFVRVYPVQFAPLAGRLDFATQVNVSIIGHSEPGTAQAGLRRHGQARDRATVAAMVDNPAQLPAHRGVATHSAAATAVYDYLLITKPELVSSFQPLIDQKVADGLKVKVETVPQILANFAGRDGPEKIRNSIRHAYTNWGITYVLLGGDVSTVPCRYAYANMGNLTTDTQIPSDLYYACLEGSWDNDGDSVFGEPGDGEGGQEVDLLAEVYVGRAPVDTPEEATVFVEKSVRYETTPHPHLMDTLFLAEYLGSSGGKAAQGWNMFVPLTNYFVGHQLARLDDLPFTVPQWTTADAIRELNRSPHLVLFNGHGDPDSMMRMISDDLDALTNSLPFFVYSVGCDAGAFDNVEFWPDSIGEELVKRHSRAAFASILNSRLGWYDARAEWKWSGEFQIKFFEQVLNRGNRRLGVANQLGKHDMVSRVETSGIMTYRYCYFEINLLGDPHLSWQSPSAEPKLEVSSVHGGASPAIGTAQYPHGSLLTCSVTNSPLLAGQGVRYVCTGWNGAGSVPSTGTGTQLNFTLSQDSQLSWSWATQVWLSAAAQGNGSVSIPEGWMALGSTQMVVAVPANYFHFVRWSGDVPVGTESSLALTLVMDRPLTVSALFEENRTSLGVPEWWLAGFGWTNSFETASMSDPDRDGMASWEEYEAGTVPTDPASLLKVTVALDAASGPDPVLSWPSATGRIYSLYWSSEAGGPFVLLTNGIAAQPPVNTFADRNTRLGTRFYRLQVETTQ